MSGPRVSVAGGEALEAVLALAKACPEAPAWAAETWAEFLGAQGPGAQVRVMLTAGEVAGEVCGALAANLLDETTELEFLMVHPANRRQGMARALLEGWFRWAREGGAKEGLLEVRAANEGARRLYEAMGFVEQGRRRAYYREPVDDAVLMRREMR